jgi:predicted DNA binding CopG/RHH family protein
MEGKSKEPIMSRKAITLDEEEKGLIEEWEQAFATGTAVEKPLSKKEREEWRKAAELALSHSKRKDQRLTIRVNGPVLKAIKAKAAQRGMRYQTYIGQILLREASQPYSTK